MATIHRIFFSIIKSSLVCKTVLPNMALFAKLQSLDDLRIPRNITLQKAKVLTTFEYNTHGIARTYVSKCIFRVRAPEKVAPRKKEGAGGGCMYVYIYIRIYIYILNTFRYTYMHTYTRTEQTCMHDDIDIRSICVYVQIYCARICIYMSDVRELDTGDMCRGKVMVFRLRWLLRIGESARSRSATFFDYDKAVL